VLTSLNFKLSNQLDEDFINDNDYMQRFLGLQKKIFMGLSEEMKSKIVLSVQNTSKIISDSNKDLIFMCKKQLTEIDQVTVERDKVVKRYADLTPASTPSRKTSTKSSSSSKPSQQHRRRARKS